MHVVPLDVGLPPRLPQLLALRVAHRIDDKARLEKDLTHICVNAPEPSTELVATRRHNERRG